MEQCLHQLYIHDDTSTDGNKSSDEDCLAACCHRILKQGMVRTGATIICKCITWPHEVLYTPTATYRNMTEAYFVQGYIVVMSAEDNSTRSKMLQHLDELICDVDLYSWKCIHAYHGVWLNQIEQGRYTGDDNEAKM